MIANREQAAFMLASGMEEISPLWFGRSPVALKEFLLEARKQYIERGGRRTLIYRGIARADSVEPERIAIDEVLISDGKYSAWQFYYK